MNTALLKTILRILLGIALSVLILIISLAFIGIGFASGVMLSSWEIVKDIDLNQLEYDQASIWKQHLEVYSSICTVQREDSGDFLLKKLERLAFKKTSRTPHKEGQYATQLDPEEKTGRIWIYLQGFHYPHADYEPFLVEIDLRQGKIVAIRNDNGADIPSFDLQPELIGEQYNKAGEAREIVSLAQMRRNEYLVKAFLAVEDKRFYQHWGVDVKGVLSAFWEVFKGAPRLRGASTITQQLTRNIYLTPERRIMRKIKEALLAVRIEARFSKDEILEKYLNLINLGRYSSREVLGVQEAAMSYFGKPVWELEIHECATLAGIPKSPTRYSPIRHPDNSKSRRNLVLDLMRREEFITQAQYEKSKKAPFDIRAPEGTKRREASHFLDYIHQQLLAMLILKDRLYNQGLKVYTTIDVSMQEVAEQAVAQHLRELDKRFRTPNYDANLKNNNGINPIKNYLQAALVAIEPRTGHIKAMVGGRDYFLPRSFRAKGVNGNFLNRAVQSQRQPGSAFKPIVFASQFEKPSLVNPATIIDDQAWFVENYGKRYAPRNYGGRYFGQVTVRKVLEKSINVATAKQTWETPPGKNGKPEGVNRAIDLAQRLGIRSPLRSYPSLALGASEVTPLEITAAYAVFANGGVRATPIGIQYIEDRDGELVFENRVQTKRVLDADVAYLITHLMEGVIKDGTGARVRRSGLKRPAAGKTGTTNDFTDAWFVGYIQNLAIGVWVGFDSPKKSTRSEGAKAALPIWTRVMLDGARGPSKKFDVPSTVVFRKIDKETGLLASDKCTHTITEAFLDGYAPQQICRAHE
jgi:1A family penicillin-binding protein